MAKASLVIMAAGIGSRFGEGIKQLEPVGPNGEIIMEYSIYDALEAGFDKVIFVIRKDIEKEFYDAIGKKIEKRVEVSYVFQEKDDIPEPYKTRYSDRVKPWGTGQAILCCKDLIQEPFLVINADDFYGKEAYRAAFQHLMEEHVETQLCMVGFILGNTLSENGSVTRGICVEDASHMLCDIEETKNIEKTDQGAVVRTPFSETLIDVNSLVSMNMWGMTPAFIEALEEKFVIFLEKNSSDYQNAEFLLPSIIKDALKEQEVKVKVLQTSDKWFGVTYKADKELVAESIYELILQKKYPEKIFL